MSIASAMMLMMLSKGERTMMMTELLRFCVASRNNDFLILANGDAIMGFLYSNEPSTTMKLRNS